MTGRVLLLTLVAAAVVPTLLASSPLRGGVQSGDYYGFIPVWRGAVKTDTPLQWKNDCFQENVATFTDLSADGAKVEIVSSKPKSWTCRDIYLVSTDRHFQPKIFLMHGKHKVSFKLTTEEHDYVKQNGIHVFSIQGSILDILDSLYKTYKLFNGKHLEADNLKFLKEKMNITFKDRSVAPIVLDESDIKSGDQLMITRLDGLDPLIMWGTGSHTGHTATFLWIEGKLYVTESTDENPFGKGYWPPPYGIIRTPYRQWMQQAEKAQFLVNFLPLAPAIRANFNEPAAVDFFLQSEGLPYGHRNFLFGWLDTEADNWPAPATVEIVTVAVSMLAKIKPDIAQQYLNEGMNFRLGTTGLDYDGCMKEAVSRGLTLGSLLAMPEQDSWTYSDGKAMVCNVYVTNLYKAAGVFTKEVTENIQATEFTPKDTYQLKIYDDKFKPGKCADDTRPYCQLLGHLWLELPGFNTITPYPKMNEVCGCNPQTGYVRPEGC